MMDIFMFLDDAEQLEKVRTRLSAREEVDIQGLSFLCRGHG